MNLLQFRNYIVRPSLTRIGAWSLAAERLVLATALAESRLEYIDQVESARGDLLPGPAAGVFQMERATHDDIWQHWIAYRPHIEQRLRGLIMRDMDLFDQLRGNLFYAAAMCRIFYLRFAEPLPDENDLRAMGEYWKRYYNTYLGAGTVDGFVSKAAAVMELKT